MRCGLQRVHIPGDGQSIAWTSSVSSWTWIVSKNETVVPEKSDLLTKMKTIDEMLHLDLLTPEQHVQIGAWIAQAGSPDEILKMPAPL